LPVRSGRNDYFAVRFDDRTPPKGHGLSVFFVIYEGREERMTLSNGGPFFENEEPESQSRCKV